MTQESVIGGKARRPLRHGGRLAHRRRPLLPVLMLTCGAGLIGPSIDSAPAYAATAPQPSRVCGARDVGFSPLARAQTIVTRARETYGNLTDAMTAIDDRDGVVLRLSLRNAQDRLEDIDSSPGATMVRAQIKVLRQSLARKSDTPDTSLWDVLGRDIDQYLTNTKDPNRERTMMAFQAAKNAMTAGKRKAADAKLATLATAIGAGAGAVLGDNAYEDVSAAMLAATPAPPLWEGARTAVLSALRQLSWMVRGKPLPLLQAYSAVADAIDACPNQRVAPRRALQAAADALEGESPALAADARKLSVTAALDASGLTALSNGIRTEIANAESLDAAAYVPPADVPPANVPP